MAVLFELLLVFLDLGREVALAALRHEQRVPRAVPGVETVLAGVVVFRIAEEPPVDGRDGLAFADEDRAGLDGGLETALTREGPGLAVGPDVDTVEPLLEDIERRIGSVDLDALVDGESAHPEVDAAFGEMEADALVPLGGQEGELDLGVIVEAEVVPLAEMDLGLAALGPHLVALDQGEIDLALLVAQVRRPLDVNGPVDVAQAGETVGEKAFILGLQAEGDRNDECDRQDRRSWGCLVHRLSPSDPYLRK
jgi:hypothetical protein